MDSTRIFSLFCGQGRWSLRSYIIRSEVGFLWTSSNDLKISPKGIKNKVMGKTSDGESGEPSSHCFPANVCETALGGSLGLCFFNCVMKQSHDCLLRALSALCFSDNSQINKVQEVSNKPRGKLFCSQSHLEFPQYKASILKAFSKPCSGH